MSLSRESTMIENAQSDGLKHNKIIFSVAITTCLILYSTFIFWTRMPTTIEKISNKNTINSPEVLSALHKIKVTSLNTEYWHSSEKELVEEINYADMDFVLLQEHLNQVGDKHFPTNRIPQLKKAISDRYISFNGEVVTISKSPSVLHRNFGDGTALRTDHMLEDGKIISVYNVHLPVHLHFDLFTTPLTFITDMRTLVPIRENLIDALKADILSNTNYIVIGGDFNTSIAMNSISWLRDNLVDVFSAPHCEFQYGTWILGNILSWRIDYIFTSRNITPQSYCTKQVNHISDHSAIYSELYLN